MNFVVIRGSTYHMYANLGGLSHSIQLITALLLTIELGRYLGELPDELAQVSAAMSLDELHGGGGLWRRGSREVAIHHRVDVGVPKREYLLTRREDDESDLSATECAELAGFLEKPRATLGEGDLQVALVAHLLHLHLLATLALPRGRRRHG